MNWRLWTWKDWCGGLLVLAITGTIIYFAVFVPHTKTNFGFGPDWVCRLIGDATVCLKKSPTP